MKMTRKWRMSKAEVQVNWEEDEKDEEVAGE
jgi:hypothetical protein